MGLLDSIQSRASSTAARGLQLAQRGADQIPGAVSNLGRDIFPAGTGKRIATTVARNINSRVGKQVTNAALNFTPYGRAIKAAKFAYENKKLVLGLATPFIALFACMGLFIFGMAFKTLDQLQNDPLGYTGELLQVAGGKPLVEVVGEKSCENAKERLNIDVNCAEVSKQTNAAELSN